MKLINEGAEAKIYAISAFGEELVLKRREPKNYRQAILDEKIRRERTRREARIISKLYSLGINVPRPIAFGNFSILMEKLGGALLKDIKQKREIIPAAGRMLAEMHKNDIAHGDFTPANLVLYHKSIYVIDFGLSEFTKSPEEKALDILLMKRSLAPSLYDEFEKSYKESYQQSKTIIKRLMEIEKRGRYQIRTLT